MIKRYLSALIGISCFITTSVNALELNKHPKLSAIADDLVAQKLYSRAELDKIFDTVEVQQSVLNAMKNPAEYKFTWGKYRKIFMQPERIQRGVEFWRQHADTLSKAQQEYGVPAHVIVAIIGVESKFGQYKGKHKVLDSLATLVTGYPRRSKFFAKELKDFLILTKENDLQPHDILGSYAGAVGFPQFISSSYRHYAVDFSNDGKTDLINQPVDAIGSVANYFKENGWLTGQAVTSEGVRSVSSAVIEKANRKRKTQYSAKQLRDLGAVLPSSVADDEVLNVLMLDSNQEVVSSPEKGLYIVRAGDTACQIAERHKMRCKTFFALNKLDEQGTIYRGQRLKVAAQTQTKDENQSKWQLANTVEQSGERPLYFYTHENFYVITRYNHSVLYAMAVHELSNAIKRAYH